MNCSKMNILSGKNKEFVEVNSIGIEYRKLSEKELDVFIEMRINQLREEGAKADIDLKPALLDYYMRHMKDGICCSS